MLADSKTYDLFYNEIEIMRELDHENIIKLQEVWESNNFYYLLMEVLLQGTLTELITEAKEL